MSRRDRPLTLLALDGGGVRGLSELIILEEIMLRIQKQENLAIPPKPCELFDLICGTSTGGLIALMLGRLQISVDQVIAEYCNVAREVFGKPKKYNSEGRFRATALESVVQSTVARYGLPKGENDKADPGLKLVDDQHNQKCQVFVCSRNARAMDKTRVFRSYRSYTADEYLDMTIWEAARATSAAPTFFKRLKIGPKHAQEEFLDGGLGSNNPTRVLIDEVIREFSNKDQLACIVSVGTGKTRITEFKCPDMATDCETVATELDKRFASRPGIYFRFNVEHGLEDVPMEEWKELGNIKAKTIQYLGERKISQAVDEVAAALRSRAPRILVSELDSRITVKTRSILKCIVPFERRVSYFAGRMDVLNNIRTTFNKSDTNRLKTTVIVLRAMGGQGKTQVVLEYCRCAQEEDYDYILWVDAETRTSLEQSFSTFAQALTRPKSIESTIVLKAFQEGTSSLDLVLDQLVGKKYLMVIDNLDKPSEHKDIKKCTTIVGGTGHIIITSRHLDTERLGSSIDLPAFSMREGSDLLTNRSGRKENIDEVHDQEKITFALGGLPLGLDQAALLIREKNSSYSQFLKDFQEARTTLLDKDLPEFWDYEKLIPGDANELEMRRKIGIQTTWTMSFSYLASQPHGRSKCHLLTLSAYLSSAEISQATFSPFFAILQTVLENMASFGLNSSFEEYLGMLHLNRLETVTLVRAATWVNPLLGETDAYSISGMFSDFIRDAYKVGLVTSTQYHEARGTMYSIHPLVSRWLVNQDNNHCVIESFFLIHYFLCDFNDNPNSRSIPLEVSRHVVASISHNKWLPVATRLGMGDLHDVGMSLCCHILDSELPQLENVIDILTAARDHIDCASEEVKINLEILVLRALGTAYQRTRQFDKAKEIMELTLSRKQLGRSFMTISSIIRSLAEVYVRLEADALLISICQNLTYHLGADSWRRSDPRQGPDSCSREPATLHHVNEKHIISSKKRGQLQALPSNFWLRTLSSVCLSFEPRFDLAQIALVQFLETVEQQFHPEGLVELRHIVVAAQYILGVLYFVAGEWWRAQNQFQSVLQAVQAEDTSDCILTIELCCSVFTVTATQLADGATQTLVVSAQEKAAALFAKRTLSQAQAANVERSFKIIDGLRGQLLRRRATGRLALAHVLNKTILLEAIPGDLIEITCDELERRLFASDVDLSILSKAVSYVQTCVEEQGYSEYTARAYDLTYTMAYMLGKWEVCSQLAYDRIQHIKANGKEPENTHIHDLGRIYLHLEEHDKYTALKEQYPHGDWARVEEE